MLSVEEMGALLASINTTTLIGLRDRALIGLMGYTSARVGAAVGIKVEDYYIQKRRAGSDYTKKAARSPSSLVTTTWNCF